MLKWHKEVSKRCEVKLGVAELSMITYNINEYNVIEWYRHDAVFEESTSSGWVAFLNGDVIIEVDHDMTQELANELSENWVKENW